MTMSDVDIDTSRLIELVEINPQLWDRTLESYKNRAEVQDLWWQISSQIIDEQFGNKTPAEQKQIVQEVKKKWINIRDSWIKNFKKTQRGPGKKKRKYIYHKQLQFLSKVVNLNQSTISEENQDERRSHGSEDDQTSAGEERKEVQQLYRPVMELPDSAYLRTVDRKELSDPPSSDTRTLEELELRLPVVNAEPKVEDHRLMFFKGILPFVNHFSNDQFIDFQIGVLQLIKSVNSQTTMQ